MVDDNYEDIEGLTDEQSKINILCDKQKKGTFGTMASEDGRFNLTDELARVFLYEKTFFKIYHKIGTTWTETYSFVIVMGAILSFKIFTSGWVLWYKESGTKGITVMESIVEVLLLIVTSCFFYFQERNIKYALHFASWMACLVWVNTMFYIGRFETIGPFIMMLFEVTYNMVLLIIAAIPLILAYSLGFHIVLLPDDDFDNFWATVLRTLVMMVNGFYDDEDLDENAIGRAGSAQLMYLLFMVGMVIIFMNILLAVTVNITKNVKDQSKLLQSKRRINDIIISYRIFPRFLSNLMNWLCWGIFKYTTPMSILKQCQNENTYKASFWVSKRQIFANSRNLCKNHGKP